MNLYFDSIAGEYWYRGKRFKSREFYTLQDNIKIGFGEEGNKISFSQKNIIDSIEFSEVESYLYLLENIPAYLASFDFSNHITETFHVQLTFLHIDKSEMFSHLLFNIDVPKYNLSYQSHKCI